MSNDLEWDGYMCRQVSGRHHPFILLLLNRDQSMKRTTISAERSANKTSFGKALQFWTFLSLDGQRTTKA